TLLTEGNNIPDSQQSQRIADFVHNNVHGSAARSVPWETLKLVLVGSEGAGKSTLIKRICDPSCSREALQHNASTNGIDIRMWNVDEHVRLRCFDFAGQQLFHGTHEFFLSERAIYLVVFSVINPESYTSRIRYWLKTISAFHASTTPIAFVVGTHADRISSESVSTVRDYVKSQVLTQFPWVKGPYIVSSLPTTATVSTTDQTTTTTPSTPATTTMPATPTATTTPTPTTSSTPTRPSDLTSSSSSTPPSPSVASVTAAVVEVDYAIEPLIEKIVSSARSHRLLKRPVPDSYLRINAMLGTLAATHQTLGWEDFVDVCSDHLYLGSPSETLAACRDIARFLHESGQLLYFDNLLVLSPQFLADLLATVYSLSHRWVVSGHITYDALTTHIWRNYPAR
ncbi:MAG: 50S ribosome-binding GTPase, partial [Microbacteriaceae bacterium]|nr:50S ribosome-binding GTPase [Microbacteriaceae bacterium]